MFSTTIRRAAPHEADRLTALMHASSAYRGHYATILSGYRVTSAYIARHQVFAAVGGGEDAGYGDGGSGSDGGFGDGETGTGREPGRDPETGRGGEPGRGGESGRGDGGPGEGRLQGFYSLVLDPPELDLIFVADETQGSGVGRLLVEHMIGQAGAHGLDEVRVVSHPPAERFYRRLGAERIGTVPPSPPKISWERPELRFTTA
ncbi:GNAT family N-acetyltransferase [Streptomyces iconiensis]|uniref:GNAT family N-acetyltransferase n=1 Tax=Streptomyces iconiensis TaxID=1384038 RepID=A0ABT6ZN63_9ACTN|nr:GNAT family N-acetyltransferase [Streptomyces iconiensis]MDJ1130492.1 GNAT family N-acetyltransferase [Streptomyces iconiensis]